MHLTPNRLLKIFSRKDAEFLPFIEEISAQTPSVSMLIDGIWARHDKICRTPDLKKGAACVVGFAEAETVIMRDMLRQIGLGPCVSSFQTDALQDLASLKNAFSYLVVNADAFEDTETAVTALMDFRYRRDDVVIILASTNVAFDDLGAERRMICDATLRAPVTLSRLRRGVAAAFENNSTNRQRR